MLIDYKMKMLYLKGAVMGGADEQPTKRNEEATKRNEEGTKRINEEGTKRINKGTKRKPKPDNNLDR